MDQLIWDFESLHRMLVLCSQALRRLEECSSDLRGIFAQGMEIFKDNTGASRRILDEIETLIHRIDRAGEQAAGLTGALTQVQDMISSTETSIVRLVSGLEQEKDAPADPADGHTAPGDRLPAGTMPTTVWAYDVMPDWLLDAANRAFEG